MNQSTSRTRRDDLIWHLTGRAIVGLTGLGIAAAIAVGGWSLRMQMSSGNEITKLVGQMDRLEIARVEQATRDSDERRRLEIRIVELEAWGPKSGPRVTNSDLDKRIAEVMASYHQLYEQVVKSVERIEVTQERLTDLIIRHDERLNQMDKGDKP